MIKMPFGLFKKRADKILKIAILGTCQVLGMAETARRLLPGAEIKAWHVGVAPADTEEEILAQLPDYDLIICQVSEWDSHEALRPSRMRQTQLPYMHVPPIVFTGFHPDTTYVLKDGGVLGGPGTDYHSILVATAFVLGVPEHRVPGLFNTYVFAELGYLDAFESARAALIDSFATAAGLDIAPLFDLWLAEGGPFMHTINHPNIFALASLTRFVLSQAGYVEADASLPTDLPDDLGRNFRTPVYPPLARRIGLEGSTLHGRSLHQLAEGETRDVALEDYVAASYRLYREIDPALLPAGSGGITAARQRLDSVIVR